MKGKGENEGKAHQKAAEEFARKYLDEEQGRNRKHVLDSHKLIIKQALFRQNQHLSGERPQYTDEELDQYAMNQIEREKMRGKAGGKRRRKTKRRYTKKR